MDPASLAREIERLRRKWTSVVRGEQESFEVPVRWTLSGAMLRWHVAFEDVIEPDIDVEILPQVLVIRGRPATRGASIQHALLPIPPGFDGERPRIRCEAGYLEICLHRLLSEDGA